MRWTDRVTCESRPVYLYLSKIKDMKEDYRNLDNAQLSKLIQNKTQELIELRNELSRRAGEKLPIVNYDFTKRVTD